LLKKGKFIHIFHSIIWKSLVNFGAAEGWFSYFTNSVQFGEIRKLSVTDQAMNSAAQVPIQTRATFETPTEAHSSVAQE
jgi:hypothetical protein